MHKLFFLKYQSIFTGLDSTDQRGLHILEISRVIAPGLGESQLLIVFATNGITCSEAKG
jgi:hypothetical protein